jgi:hypothetical protein
MTIDQISLASTNGHRPAPAPAPRRRRAAQQPPGFINLARIASLAITIAIAAASFALSFSTLRDLALHAGYSPSLAWVWPLTIDATIVQSTAAIVTLAGYSSQRRHRQFFWAVLAAAATTSVAGNVLHALLPHDLPPVVAAVIAAIPPLSLLATTHGLAVLVKFRPPARQAQP